MTIVAEGNRQRVYLPPTELHELAAGVARPEDVFDSEMPDNPRWFSPPMYGMTHHADLFTNRQLTALCTLSDLIGEARARVLVDSGDDASYADAVSTYLAFGLDRLADMGCSLARWKPTMDQSIGLFSRQAVPMVWDYAETSPFSGAAGDLTISLNSVVKVLARLPSGPGGAVAQLNATQAPLDGLILSTDPPYYDNIGYADLSDLFYVWLRRSLRAVYPDLLGTVLTPKNDELIATPYRFDGDKSRAEKQIGRAHV